MLLLEKVHGESRSAKQEEGGGEAIKWRQGEYSITHQIEDQRTRPGTATHVIRVFKPNPTAGPMAGKLVALFRLTADQAKELKAHL